MDKRVKNEGDSFVDAKGSVVFYNNPENMPKLTKAMILKARQTGINRKYSEDDLLRIFKKTLK